MHWKPLYSLATPPPPLPDSLTGALNVHFSDRTVPNAMKDLVTGYMKIAPITTNEQTIAEMTADGGTTKALAEVTGGSPATNSVSGNHASHKVVTAQCSGKNAPSFTTRVTSAVINADGGTPRILKNSGTCTGKL